MNKLFEFISLLKYFNKKYYCGRVRWLLIDKNQKSIYCCKCGNIANGCGKKKIYKFNFLIPYCKKHLGEIYFTQDNHKEFLNFPCIIEI